MVSTDCEDLTKSCGMGPWISFPSRCSTLNWGAFPKEGSDPERRGPDLKCLNAEKTSNVGIADTSSGI